MADSLLPRASASPARARPATSSPVIPDALTQLRLAAERATARHSNLTPEELAALSPAARASAGPERDLLTEVALAPAFYAVVGRSTSTERRDQQDLLVEAIGRAAMKAARYWNPARGGLWALAATAGKQDLTRLRRAGSHMAKRSVSIEEPTPRGLPLAQRLVTAPDNSREMAAHQTIRVTLVAGLLDVLTAPQRDAIERHYGLPPHDEPQSVREIGEELGISHQAVTSRLSGAIRRLRAALSKREG